MIGGFLNYIGEIFVKFITGFPDSSTFDFTTSVAKVRTVLGYINYFFPMHDIAIIFHAWVFMIGIVTFGFLLVHFIKDAIPF